MDTRKTILGVIFTGFSACLLSGAVLAAEHQSMEEETPPVRSTDPSGMEKKDSAAHEKMHKQGGMSQDASNKQQMQQGKEGEAPYSTTDQSGMEKKDSANQE